MVVTRRRPDGSIGLDYVYRILYTSSPRPGSFSTQNKTAFSVNGFWTGGYENECRWHTTLMATVEAAPLPLAEFLVGAVFAVLVIVVKLEITARVYPSAEIAEDEPNPANYGPPQPM